MKKVVLSLILFLMSALAFPMSFPQIVVGDGTECVILISNKSSEAWGASFIVRQGNDEKWSGPLWVNGSDMAGFDGFQIEILPFATFKIRLTGGAQLQAGYIEVDTDMDSSMLDVAVSFFYNFRNARGELTDSVSIPPSLFSDTVFLFPVERSASVDTGFAWCPWLIEGPFDVLVTLYQPDGTVFQSKTVSFTGHGAQFFAQVFDNVPAEFMGLMRIESENFIHVAVLRIEYTESGFQYAGAAPDTFEP